MPAILYRLQSGVPGTISRDALNATVEAQIADPSNPLSAFGLPVVMDADGVRGVTTGDAASAVYGIAVRPFPTQGADSATSFGPGAPNSPVLDVLKRGYISVKVNAGTPAVNTAVYVRVANPSGAKVIGGFEAAADSTNTIALTNAYFMGPVDASGNSEIAYNI